MALVILVVGALSMAFVRMYYLPYYHMVANQFVVGLSFSFALAAILTASLSSKCRRTPFFPRCFSPLIFCVLCSQIRRS